MYCIKIAQKKGKKRERTSHEHNKTIPKKKRDLVGQFRGLVFIIKYILKSTSQTAMIFNIFRNDLF